MNSAHLKLLSLAAACIAAASLAACHDDTTTVPPVTTSTTNSENFSTFANAAFAQSANSQPQVYDQITLVFDVDNDPTAFNALLM